MTRNTISLFLGSIIIGVAVVLLLQSSGGIIANTASSAIGGSSDPLRVEIGGSSAHNHSLMAGRNASVTISSGTPQLVSMEVKAFGPRSTLHIHTPDISRTITVPRITSRVTFPVPRGRTTGTISATCDAAAKERCSNATHVRISDIKPLTPNTTGWGNAYGTGWYPQTPTEQYRWGQNHTTLHTWNPHNTTEQVFLRLSLLSPGQERIFKLIHENQRIGTIPADTSREYSIHAIPLQASPGWNTLHITTESSCTRFGNLHGNDDRRCAAIGIQSFSAQGPQDGRQNRSDRGMVAFDSVSPGPNQTVRLRSGSRIRTYTRTSRHVALTVTATHPGTMMTLESRNRTRTYSAPTTPSRISVPVLSGRTDVNISSIACERSANKKCPVSVQEAQFISPHTATGWGNAYGTGWYPQTPTEQYRWGQNHTTLHTWNPHNTTIPTRFRLGIRSFGQNRTVFLEHNNNNNNNNTLVNKSRVSTGGHEIADTVRLHPGQNTITLWTPSACTRFGAVYKNDDRRCAAIGIDSFEISPELPWHVSLRQQEAKDVKVALIVFDGGDWTVINQLQQQNRLPHLTKMMNNGIYGNFSTPRAFSPISWTKIATGQQTQDVNITAWNTVDDGATRMVKSTDIEHRRIWNYLNTAGISTGIIQWLLTWPVEEIDGYMVAGPMARSEQQVAHPESAYNRTAMRTIRHDDEWAVGRMMLPRVTGETPFVALGFKRLDSLQHQLWKFIEPEPFGIERKPEHNRYREQIYQEYERLDNIVSRFGPEWNIIIVSDSGFEPEGTEMGRIAPTYESNLNPLLKQLGYVDYEYRIVKNQRVTDVLPGSDLRWCPPRYPQNDVINSTHYRFRLCIRNTHIQPQAVIDRVQDVAYPDGKRFFQNLTATETGDAITGMFRLREQYFNRTRVRTGYIQQPTVTGKTYYIDRALQLHLPNGTPYNLWLGPEKSGDHPPGTDGIFIASGPDFTDDGELTEISPSTIDIAPTLLYMYDLPIPHGMEGRPQRQLFTSDFRSQRQARYANITVRRQRASQHAEANNETVDALKQRLRNLGYTVN